MVRRTYLSTQGSAIILLVLYILMLLCPSVVSSNFLVMPNDAGAFHPANDNVRLIGTLAINDSRVLRVEGNITYICDSSEPSYLLAIDTSDKYAPIEVDVISS